MITKVVDSDLIIKESNKSQMLNSLLKTATSLNALKLLTSKQV